VLNFTIKILIFSRPDNIVSLKLHIQVPNLNVSAIRKQDEEYEPGTLTGIQYSIDIFLREKKVPLSIKKTHSLATQIKFFSPRGRISRDREKETSS